MATTQIELEQAAGCLPALVDEATKGTEVILTKDNQPIARLVPYVRSRRRPQFGSAKGLVSIADDFDAPLDDFKEYME